MTYIAYRTTLQSSRPPLVVIDLGYAEEIASCGVRWSGLTETMGRQFYRAVAAVKDGLTHYLSRDMRPLLVIEAPLSRAHKANGNPTCRGAFEEGRNWYRQPGSGLCIGAIRLLEVLSDRLDGDIWLAEAFLSNKVERTAHWRDAEAIHNQFWNIAPVFPNAPQLDPLCPLIQGIPEVRVFVVPSNGVGQPADQHEPLF